MENPAPASAKRPMLQRIFISPDETRLRAGWRLLIEAILLMIFGLLTLLAISFITRILPVPPSPAMELLFNSAIQFIAITGSVFLARRFIDRRTIVSLGLKFDKQMVEDLLAGFLIPALMMALILLLERVFGWSKFMGFVWQGSGSGNSITALLTGLIAFIIVGWQEELLDRGYILQNLEDGLKLPWAVIISSSIFAVLHLANPNTENKIMVTSGIFMAGVFLAYAYLRTRQLWLPIGLHIGWNFFEGPIFGFPVSGLDADGLFVHVPTGPEIITGGAFGPEAGLILLPALAVGFVLVYFVTTGRKVEKLDGRIVPKAGPNDTRSENDNPDA